MHADSIKPIKAHSDAELAAVCLNSGDPYLQECGNRLASYEKQAKTAEPWVIQKAPGENRYAIAQRSTLFSFQLIATDLDYKTAKALVEEHNRGA